MPNQLELLLMQRESVPSQINQFHIVEKFNRENFMPRENKTDIIVEKQKRNCFRLEPKLQI